MSELATIEHGSTLVLAEEQTFWNGNQVAALRQMGVEQASDGDLGVFFHVCQRTGLDPFARQIHMIGRNTKDQRTNQWVTKYTIQTGIDGYRLIARRASDRLGETLEYDETLWCGADGEWSDVWLKATAPTAAKVMVLRHGKRFPAVALYREFVQTKRDGQPNSMWASMPANQLAKCAEALALRKAFPQDLSGIYTDDEMGQADRHERQESPDLTAPASVRMASMLSTDPGQPAINEPPTMTAMELITSAQLKKLQTVLSSLSMDRDSALAFYASITGREVESSKALTKDEAGAVIDGLEALEQQPFAEPVATTTDPETSQA